MSKLVKVLQRPRTPLNPKLCYPAPIGLRHVAVGILKDMMQNRCQTLFCTFVLVASERRYAISNYRLREPYGNLNSLGTILNYTRKTFIDPLKLVFDICGLGIKQSSGGNVDTTNSLIRICVQLSRFQRFRPNVCISPFCA